MTIKYRAWKPYLSKSGTQKGRMVQVTNLTLSEAVAIADWKTVLGNDTHFSTNNVDEDFVLMQYTGLSTNGDVYDKDILRDPNSGTTAIVFWDDEDYRWAVKTIEEVSLIEPLSDWIDAEIIGNLYENPELLEFEED